MHSTPHTPWRSSNVYELTPNNLAALLDSRIPAIRIPQFASPKECEALIAAINHDHFAYSPAQSPPIGRIGITQYSHCDKAPESYFSLVKKAEHTIQNIFSRSFDPVTRMIGYLEKTWPKEVKIADCEHGRYYAGLIRLIHEYAGLHFDFVPIEGTGWSLDNISAQISWNLHASTANKGGGCVVYDQRCEPEHQSAHYDPNQLLADPAHVADSTQVLLEGTVGDVVLFNTRNYHEVLPCSGGLRITVSSFIGKMPDGGLVLWS